MTPSPPIIALPETRQLDVLAQMLERRDMRVIRCPMVAINDAPEAEPIVEWINRLIRTPMDLLIVYTGEGVERLRGFAERAGLEAEFIAALAKTPLLTRGPKPKRALRKLDIKPKFEAANPTTEGVIATLSDLELAGKRIGVQLYGSDPNETLMSYLDSRGLVPDCIAPYVYASAADDERVKSLIQQMCGGEVDAIAFTSKSQVERLRKVATRAGLSDGLKLALGSVVVAAVGPIVGQALEDWGIAVDVMPERDFFMKPLVTRLVNLLVTPQ